MNLDRRAFLGAGASAGIALLLGSRASGATAEDNLYGRSIAIDGLGGLSGMSDELGQEEIEVIAGSGMTALHMTIGDTFAAPPLEIFESIIREADRWDREAERHPTVLMKVRAASDIEKAKADGRMGLIYGLQNGTSFQDDLDRMTAIHRAGVRVIQPTYNRRNLLGDGCMEPADAGMSRTGVESIERMCELGFTIDLSHCGRRTTADAMSAATRPVSFTHTGCFAITGHPRHRTDQEMRAAADSGGITGIYVMPYLSKGAQPTAADVVQHLEHAVDVAGEDHVSIGTDGRLGQVTLTDEYKTMFRDNVRERKELGVAAPFETEEGYLFANDLNDARRFEILADMLLDRGHSESRVEKILGANLVRVFRETWND